MFYRKNGRVFQYDKACKQVISEYAKDGDGLKTVAVYTNSRTYEKVLGAILMPTEEFFGLIKDAEVLGGNNQRFDVDDLFA